MKISPFKSSHLLATAIFCLGTVVAFEAEANSHEECVAIADDGERLDCYDEAFRPKTSVDGTDVLESEWLVRIDKSEFEDTTDVYMSVVSTEPVQCRSYGSKAPLTLFVRCRENTTSIFFTGDCHLTSGYGGYGDVDIRVDDERSFTRGMDESTNNSALGLWRGGSAIPLVKNLLGRDQLLIRFTPFSMSAVTAKFNISGMDEEIKPLRQACGW